MYLYRRAALWGPPTAPTNRPITAMRPAAILSVGLLLPAHSLAQMLPPAYKTTPPDFEDYGQVSNPGKIAEPTGSVQTTTPSTAAEKLQSTFR